MTPSVVKIDTGRKRLNSIIFVDYMNYKIEERTQQNGFSYPNHCIKIEHLNVYHASPQGYSETNLFLYITTQLNYFLLGE